MRKRESDSPPSDLRTIPGVGPSIAQDLLDVGFPARLRPAPQEPGGDLRGGLRAARPAPGPLPPLRLPLRRLLREHAPARPGEAEVVELEGCRVPPPFGERITLPLIPAIQRHVAVFAVGPATVRGQGARGSRRGGAGFPLRSPAAVVRAFDRILLSERIGLRDGRPRDGVSEAGAQLGPRAKVPEHLSARRVLQLSPRAPVQPGSREAVLRASARRSCRARPHRAGWTKTTAGLARVKHLQPVTSETYQAFALELSRKWKIDRVYLDTYVWVENRGRSGK